MFESGGCVDILALLSPESTPQEWECLGRILWDVGLLRGVEPTCRLLSATAHRLRKSSQAMRERLQKVKKGLLHRAQVTLTDIIAKEKELAHLDSLPVGSRDRSFRPGRDISRDALGAMKFVSYLFIYGFIPSKFVFVIGEQLLDIRTDLTSTMLAVFLTTDKFMALHDTIEWSQYDKFERLLDRVQALADDATLSPVATRAMLSILSSRENASHDQYLAEGFYSDESEESDGHDTDDEIENQDPMPLASRIDVQKSCKSDCRPPAKPDPVNSVPLSKWSATDVSNFLVRNGLEMYVDVFAAQGIDGDICYHDLSVDMLEELGVQAWHRGKLLRLLKGLI
jgi:hypothetical protein